MEFRRAVGRSWRATPAVTCRCWSARRCKAFPATGRWRSSGRSSQTAKSFTRSIRHSCPHKRRWWWRAARRERRHQPFPFQRRIRPARWCSGRASTAARRPTRVSTVPRRRWRMWRGTPCTSWTTPSACNRRISLLSKRRWRRRHRQQV